MANLLVIAVLLLVLPVNSLRDTDEASESMQTNPDDDQSAKGVTFDQNHDCQTYPEFKEQFVTLPCQVMKAVMHSTKDELLRQAKFAALEALLFSVFTGIGQTAEVGSVAANISSAGNTIPASLAVSSVDIGLGDAQLKDSIKRIALECCPCEVQLNVCVAGKCFKDAMIIYDKVTKMHQLVNTTKKIATVTGITAALAGPTIDLVAGGTTMGAGTVIGGNIAMYAGATSAVLSIGHVTTSCVQRDWLKKCWAALCP